MNDKSILYYVSDFETTSKNQYEIEKRTRVYLHYTENIYEDEDNFLGLDIEDYFKFIATRREGIDKKVVFFHNLTFDILFLEYYLQSIGFTFREEKSNGSYYVLRDEFKSVYQMKIYVNDFEIEIRDSFKLLSSSVDRLPNLRGLEKLDDFDYYKIRNEKTLDDFTERELLYVKVDVWKVKDILKELLVEIGDFLTIASSSYSDWKTRYTKDDDYKFRNDFPPLNDEEDFIIRKAYNGGLVILNPKYQGKIITEPVLTFDVNSLYPSVMRFEKMPYGKPIKIGTSENYEYLKRRGIELFMFCVDVSFMEIKKGHHPYVSETKSYMFGSKKSFESRIENATFYWTNIDLENARKYYNIEYEIDYMLSYGFNSKYGIFDEYIDHYNHLKENAPNLFMRMFAKFRLNTLYGKFGTRAERLAYRTVLNDETELLEFEIFENNSRTKFYLPIAVFITAYARDKLITKVQEEREAFIYADTDSLHVFKSKFKNSLQLDKKKLGFWDFETEASKSLYYANKQYIKEVDGEIQRTVASLNRQNHHLVNFENLRKGSIIKKGKRMRKEVKGGYIITESDFTFT